MKVLWFSIVELFWLVMIKAEIVYRRIRCYIERKWILRKKEKTTWADVWSYLDYISGPTWADNHHNRLRWFYKRKHNAWVKKIDFKYRVNL